MQILMMNYRRDALLGRLITKNVKYRSREP
jgi:hypothetical protein